MNAETMCQIAKYRHAEELQHAEAFRLARLVQGGQPPRAQQLLNQIIAFAKRVGAKRFDTAQTAEVLPLQVRREQPETI